MLYLYINQAAVNPQEDECLSLNRQQRVRTLSLWMHYQHTTGGWTQVLSVEQYHPGYIKEDDEWHCLDFRITSIHLRE